MKFTFLLLGLGLFVTPCVRANVLFLDLNDSPKELAACQEGLRDAGQGHQVVSVGPSGGDERPLTMEKILGKVEQARRKGINFDSIVISGEDGSGVFFGSEGSFSARQLRGLVEKMNQGGSKVRTAALWGCYPTTKHGCQTYWLKAHPSINMAVGFSTQGPSKERPANHRLMREYCKIRDQAARAASIDQLCLFYFNLSKGINDTSVGVCNRRGVASDFYDTLGRDGRRSGENICQTYDELQARCGQAGDALVKSDVFDNCMSGGDSTFDFDRSCGDAAGRSSPLRKYYNQLHLWRHCKEQVNTEHGFEMPEPMTVIRLLKFKYIRDNLARLNARELNDYDDRLRQIGLQNFTLGDIRNLSRRELRERVEGAISILRGGRSSRLSTADAAVLKMAEGLGRTFLSLDSECSSPGTINPGKGRPSQCLLTYEKAIRR